MDLLICFLPFTLGTIFFLVWLVVGWTKDYKDLHKKNLEAIETIKKQFKEILGMSEIAKEELWEDIFEINFRVKKIFGAEETSLLIWYISSKIEHIYATVGNVGNSEENLEVLMLVANKVKEAYEKLNRRRGIKTWSINEYIQGFSIDVNDLSKLIMEKTGFRQSKKINLDEQISHELSDCMWSLLVVAAELKIDIGPTFVNNMNELKQKIKSQIS